MGGSVNYEELAALDEPWVGEGQRLGVELLDEFFARTPRLAVAFSGGCDSAYLLAAARAAGVEVHAYLVKSPFQAEFELTDALRVIEALQVPFTVLEHDMLAHADVCANLPDRCYRCKGVIFDLITAAARQDGFSVVADGTNASDNPARRPGFRALVEAGVISPLRRAGLTKAAIRRASAELARSEHLDPHLLLADKPSFPCLAALIPTGEPITADALRHAAGLS